MNLVDYGRILWQRGWIIVLLAVLTAGSAFALSRLQTPVYRASLKVLLLPSRSDWGLTQASTQLLDTYVELLRSTFITQQLIDQLQLDMTPQDLLSKVTFATDRQRLTVQIDVDIEGQDEALAGNMANDIARAWGQWLVDYRTSENQRARREDRIDARMQDEPRYSRNRPNTTLNLVAGGVLGVLLGAVVIFVLEYVESSVVRRREDLERTLDIAVLATIPANEGGR
jgi:capsular polysaccharide biosynthesis protein